MSNIIASWAQFEGGHWGALGPRLAAANQWGGVNMMVGRDGSIGPASASRQLPLNAQVPGKVWGMFWAWGADGRIYYVQQNGTSTNTSQVYRFTPTPDATQTLSTTTTFTFVPTTDPDWVELGTTVYVTFYGGKTYTIDTAGNTMTILTGNYGNAAAGRCICLYREFLMVGGVSDGRMGTHTNRIHFSGDLTGFGGGNPNTADRTAWEALNFFDIGTDGDTIVGLYSVRDFLVAVMDDQSIYVITGTPGVNATARRVYGFHKGSGGVSGFLPSHGIVDPSQTKMWLFDHTQRTPARFNGASLARLTSFGIPQVDRTATTLVEGAMASIGGPDEFVVNGVAVSRAAGEQTVGYRLILVRQNGVYSLLRNSVIASRQLVELP